MVLRPGARTCSSPPTPSATCCPAWAGSRPGWGSRSWPAGWPGWRSGARWPLSGYLDPLLQFARALPAVTLVPVFIALFRLGTQMEVATITFGTIWPILLNTIDGARSVDPLQMDTARVFRLPGWPRLTRLIIPATMPRFFAGLRLSVSLALVLMVFAELAGSSNGLGYEMNNAESSFDMTCRVGDHRPPRLLGNAAQPAGTGRGAPGARLAPRRPRKDARTGPHARDHRPDPRVRSSGTGHPALDGITLTVGEGELVSIVGPSGCGKSTLLRCVAGLIRPAGGQRRPARRAGGRGARRARGGVPGLQPLAVALAVAYATTWRCRCGGPSRAGGAQRRRPRWTRWARSV